MKDNTQPIPQGKYVPARRHKDVVYTSGMTPRVAGELVFFGKIKADDLVSVHKEAIELATLNAINAAQSCLHDAEKISIILQLNVFLNAESEFKQHAKMADYASEILIERFGINCIGSRVAVGVASLPSNATVEVSLTAAVA